MGYIGLLPKLGGAFREELSDRRQHGRSLVSSRMAIQSKLPHVGTTMFAVMLRLATECGAIDPSRAGSLHLL